MGNGDYILSAGDAKENRFTEDKDEYGSEVMTEIHIVGRITINLWRIMKTEVTETHTYVKTCIIMSLYK